MPSRTGNKSKSARIAQKRPTRSGRTEIMDSNFESERELHLLKLRKLADVLDNSIAVPGTNLTLGLDAIIGLIPGIGDMMGAAISSYILFVAARLGARKRTLIKMLLNVLTDSTVGAVPLIGDFFDAAFKSNKRNVDLAVEELSNADLNPREVSQIGKLLAAIGVLIFICFICFLTLAVWFLIKALF